MNFRQRLSIIFLIVSFISWLWFFSYIFDWHAVYQRVSTEQLSEYEKTLQEEKELTWAISIKAWLSSIPFWGWCLIITVPSLQLMVFLWIMSRPNPYQPFG